MKIFCPNCSKETHRFSTILLKGKERYACPSCEKSAPKELKKAMARHRNSTSVSRHYEKYEQPKEVREQTRKLLKAVENHPAVKDTPVRRDLARIDPARPRVRIFEEGDTARSSRNARVMTKLINKLGPNPRILFDDGFQVLAESSCL